MGRPFSRWPTVGDSRSRIQWEYLDDGELLTMNRDAGSHAFDRAYWMTDSSTRHASPESRHRCQSFRTALVIACASDSSWCRVSVSRWLRTSFAAASEVDVLRFPAHGKLQAAFIPILRLFIVFN